MISMTYSDHFAGRHCHGGGRVPTADQFAVVDRDQGSAHRHITNIAVAATI